MRVAELIEKLKLCNQDAEVTIDNSSGEYGPSEISGIIEQTPIENTFCKSSVLIVSGLSDEKGTRVWQE